MTIKEGSSLIYWNYFNALEADLEEISRFIQFTRANFKTYSIELAHLLMAASSEVDVISKEICRHLEPDAPASRINEYREVITRHLPGFAKERVFIPRFGLKLHPWSNWKRDVSPDWWSSHNRVKHQRTDYFNEANLSNTLNSVAALFVSIFHFYKLEKFQANPEITNRNITLLLKPEPVLFRLEDDYYRGPYSA